MITLENINNSIYQELLHSSDYNKNSLISLINIYFDAIRDIESIEYMGVLTYSLNILRERTPSRLEYTRALYHAFLYTSLALSTTASTTAAQVTDDPSLLNISKLFTVLYNKGGTEYIRVTNNNHSMLIEDLVWKRSLVSIFNKLANHLYYSFKEKVSENEQLYQYEAGKGSIHVALYNIILEMRSIRTLLINGGYLVRAKADRVIELLRDTDPVAIHKRSELINRLVGARLANKDWLDFYTMYNDLVSNYNQALYSGEFQSRVITNIIQATDLTDDYIFMIAGRDDTVIQFVANAITKNEINTLVYHISKKLGKDIIYRDYNDLYPNNDGVMDTIVVLLCVAVSVGFVIYFANKARSYK